MEPSIELPGPDATRVIGQPPGLSQREADARRRRGEANVAVTGSSRSYAMILRTNVFSFYNSILFVIGGALLALGRFNDAFVSVGLGLVNAVISSLQELRAKRKLDRLQLLNRAVVLVVRDGEDVELLPEQVVRGDVVHVRPGDQVVVDGPVVGDGLLQVDESLLTGESDAVVKRPGDDLFSGSFCVGGAGYQLARDVGAASYANRLTAEAGRSTVDKTPLQRRIAFVVRLVMVLVALMSSAILLQAALEGLTLLRVVQTSAVLSGLVPYGMFFLIAVAYTVGATKIAGQGALIQQVNAVESISNIDTLCTDKTGTLTSGRLALKEVETVGGHDHPEVEWLLGAMAGSVSAANTTVQAIAEALPGEAREVHDEVTFTSTLRWSAVVTAEGTWVLGAYEALAPMLGGEPLADAVAARAAAGLRVLVFARAAGPAARLRDPQGSPVLPELEPMAVVALADELREGVEETVEGLYREGVELKVLSGDDPRTAAALAAQAGLGGGEPVSGVELDAMTDEQFDHAVGEATVFGRISPGQKERVVDSLRRQGRYVAMLGDGVNDARALKRAQVGVAMRSGSSVTRDVADIVLVDDSFAALLPAQQEGRRIINGIATSMYVFLARVCTQGLVIVVVTMLGLGFPYEPTQVGLTLLTVGVPTLFLTLWAKPVLPEPDLLGSLARFVIPAAVITAACGVGVYAFLYTAVARGLASPNVPTDVISAFQRYTGLTYGVDANFTTAAATIGAQTGLSTYVSLAAFGLILFLEPPTRFFAAWTRPTADKRPVVLVVVLLAAFVGVLFTPALSDYFGLTGPARPILIAVLPAVVIWFAALSAAYRWRLFDRVLGLDQLPGRDDRRRREANRASAGARGVR